jgi:tyrosinase
MGSTGPEIVGASQAPVTLVGDEQRVEIAIDPRASAAVLADAGRQAPGRILLSIEDTVAAKNPGTVYGVYVNLDDGAPPELEAAHHAGNISFFGIERARNPRADEHAHSQRTVFDITGLVSDLRARGKWADDRLSVTFRVHRLIAPETADAGEAPADPPGAADPPAAADPPVTIGRVSIAYG